MTTSDLLWRLIELLLKDKDKSSDVKEEKEKD